jgi:hypothetical protein
MTPQEKDYIFIITLAGKMKLFVHNILEPKIRRDLIPVDRIKKNKIGNEKQRSSNGVDKKHDHSGAPVYFVIKHMKNNRRAHSDVSYDQYGVKNGDNA